MSATVPDDALPGSSPLRRTSAVALSYRGKGVAPIVVAKGYGVAADAIVKVAHESGLYVHQSPEMVNLLMGLNLDSRVPPELYVAVAAILTWLGTIDGHT